MKIKKVTELVWALILIIVGLIFLFNNLGYLSWDIWYYLWKLWPLILIVAGLSVLFKDSKLLFLIPLIVAGVVIYATFQYEMPESLEPRTSTLTQTLDDAKEADINLFFGAGTITISNGSQNLFDGRFRYTDERFLPAKKYEIEDGIGELTLRSDFQSHLSHPINEWDLKFTDQIPLTLNLDYGAAQAVIDLSGLKVDRLDINGGATNTKIRFGNYSTQAYIDLGVSNLEIEIPEAVGAKIELDEGISSVKIKGLTKKDDFYVTENYETAKNKIFIDIDTGVLNIDVKVI